MKSLFTARLPRVLSICTAVVGQFVFVVGAARSEQKLTEPVYRVTTESTAAQPVAATQTAAAPAAPAAKAQLDFTQKPGEHPLAPVLRNLKISQDEIDRNVRDY